MRKLLFVAALVGLGTACGMLVSEAEFGGTWRIAEHRIERSDGVTISAYHAGFFDCNASFKAGDTFGEGCIYFLTQAYDPEAGEFYEVIDPPWASVMTTVDTDNIEEQVAVVNYAGTDLAFSFKELAGKRVLEMRSKDVDWGPVVPLDVVFIVTKD